MSAKILVVEDDDDMRSLLQAVLESSGYSVVATHDSKHAIALLCAQRFDLILLDMTLTDGSGFRVTEFLREKGLDTKVIVVTGTGGFESALRCAANGVQAYVTKPFTPPNLLKVIEHALVIQTTDPGLRLS